MSWPNLVKIGRWEVGKNHIVGLLLTKKIQRSSPFCSSHLAYGTQTFLHVVAPCVDLCMSAKFDPDRLEFAEFFQKD